MRSKRWFAAGLFSPAVNLLNPAQWGEPRNAFILGLFVLILFIILVLLIRGRRRRAAAKKQTIPTAPEPEKAVSEPVSPPPAEEKTVPIFGHIEVFTETEKLGRYPISEKPLTIGRDPGRVGIVISDPIVSKLHCSVFVRGGRVFIKDHGSTNGTFIRDQKVSEQELQDRETVLIGRKGSYKIFFSR